MGVNSYINTTNTLHKIIKYCLMFAIVLATLMILPECVMSYKNILLIVALITIAYVLLDLMIPNIIVIKLQKMDIKKNDFLSVN